jgi:FkbM family methyltransferase
MTIQWVIKKVLFRLRFMLWRMLNAVSKPDRMYSFRIAPGLRFEYPFDSAVGKYLFAGGFEADELAYFRRQLKPGDVVLDVGANAGLYTIIAARMVGEQGHVYAFEPGEAIELLRHNVALNRLNNVTIIPAAVSNTTGTASFGVATDNAMSSLAKTDRADQTIAHWTEVKTMRLDDAIKDYGIDRVDFIKVDVEGAEALVFEGARDLLARDKNRVTILFEAFDANCSAFGYSVPSLLADLHEKGFDLKGFDRFGIVPVDPAGAGVGSAIYNFIALKN